MQRFGEACIGGEDKAFPLVERKVSERDSSRKHGADYAHLQYAILSLRIVPFCVLHFTHMPRDGRVLPESK